MALYGITPDMTVEQRFEARQAWLARRKAAYEARQARVARQARREARKAAPELGTPTQTPPTFTQYTRALNVGMAVEGAKPTTIGQLEQAFRQYVAASIRRELARGNV